LALVEVAWPKAGEEAVFSKGLSGERLYLCYIIFPPWPGPWRR